MAFKLTLRTGVSIPSGSEFLLTAKRGILSGSHSEGTQALTNKVQSNMECAEVIGNADFTVFVGQLEVGKAIFAESKFA